MIALPGLAPVMGLPAIGYVHTLRGGGGDLVKRLLDLTLATPLLLMSLPLLALLALLVRVNLGAPVLFRQWRPGLHARPFELLKLRTLHDRRDADGRLLPDARRQSRFGRWLRASSLDELPQLTNVLRGEMSLVGPRPLLMEYLPLYSPQQARRHDVLPGITGWAQIHGRNLTDWEARLALDTWYAEHQSVGLDLRILARTVGKVLRSEGINRSDGRPVERFRGSL